MRYTRSLAVIIPLVLASGLISPAPAIPAAGSPERDAAQRAGRPVEIESMRSETRQVFVNPDGTYTMESHVRPVRVRKEGRWVPVDTTLRLRPDGAVEPVATAMDMTFSGGGTTALARLSQGAKALKLGWTGALPKPTLSGDTATYAEVMPGVDLQVTADVDGFSHLLVVKSPAAAAGVAELAYPLTTEGLSVKKDEAGNLEATDDSGGTTFIAPTPKMWDSTGGAPAADEERSPEARESPMDVELAGERLRLKPDQKMLADPQTRYPVYLDPYFTAPRGSWTAVWSTYPDSNYLNASGTARVGTPGSGQDNRSFFQFAVGPAVHGKQIIEATLRTYETWSWSCQKRDVHAWGTGAIGTSTTWRKQPTWVRKLDTLNVAKGWGSACLPGGVEFDVTSWIAQAAAEKWDKATIGLRASETDVFAWKRFRNNPSLVIEYNSVPADPAASDVWSDPGGLCASGDGRPIVSTTTPKLSARLKDADNSVKGHFEWWSADTKLGEHVTPVGSSGNAFSATVPAGGYADGSVLRWRVRAEDGKANGGWSPWCEATVDVTAPGKEPVVSSADYLEDVWSDGLGVAGTFVLAPNGVADVAGYLYGLDAAPATPVDSGADGTAAIRLTPRHDGPNVLAVRSKDRAGQLGPIRAYVFNVNPGRPPAAHWPLDEGQGSVAADATGAHPATLQGATWTTGRNGSALSLSGGSAQAAGPVTDTTRNFTVTAWARLTGTGGSATAVTQEGGRTGAFALQYSKPDNRWALTVPGSDADGAPAVRALSSAAPRVAEWTHLTGVYDSAAGKVSLYVNGRLESSVSARPWAATGRFTIGHGQAGGAAGDHWAGDVDEVRVYGRALFADEVADLVNSAATLVGHWKMDESAGTTAADASGRTAPAQLEGGASWGKGWLSGALALDGVNGAAQTSKPAVATATGFTVALWARLDDLPAADATAVAQVGSAAAGFQLGYDKAQRWVFGMAEADTATAALVRARSTDVPGALEWTHLAGVYDPLAGELRVYVNGRLSASTPHLSTWTATGPLHLGRTRAGGVLTGYWPGAVDDVRTYDGVLGAEQIAHLAAL
ncbi:LamG domain-containing protein [Nonomuraea sp. MG754425]|uniref:LamG-like jellyroll fold domain-containing protein n=1 Tax=Nonomuraea sp. MG754425 TaxID=2570319 RepID=UPI001F159D18|nr:LamG-like jellyroll fold domain-containing protein [Nonomuraea sp. MG754425]MCF6472823.1 LamG domain-containing protein [Nonomuraea sp. MG754425]